MHISNKGLYALEAMMCLARDCHNRPTTTHAIAASEGIPEKFLELILLDLKAARLVESVRGAKGGYRLKRAPSRIFLGEIIRTISGPLAPLADADGLRRLVKRDKRRRALYKIFLEVRDSAARILDHTSLADIQQHNTTQGTGV
jgi:Rrf2 family protein